LTSDFSRRKKELLDIVEDGVGDMDLDEE